MQNHVYGLTSKFLDQCSNVVPLVHTAHPPRKPAEIAFPDQTIWNLPCVPSVFSFQ